MADIKQAIYDNLSDKQREIADIVGIDAFVQLMKYVNGDSIYIPKYSDVIVPNRNQEICKKFNGYNFKALSDEYGLTVKSIYNIIPPELRKRKKYAAREVDGQLMF